jgi:hypothetical protein
LLQQEKNIRAGEPSAPWKNTGDGSRAGGENAG